MSDMNLYIRFATAIGPRLAKLFAPILEESLDDIKRGMRAGKKRKAIELLKKDQRALENAHHAILHYEGLPKEEQNEEHLDKLYAIFNEARR